MENIDKPRPQQTSFADFLRDRRSGLEREYPSRRNKNSTPTQAEVALKIGISSASYRALESRSPVNPTIDSLFRVQRFYKVPDELFWGKLVPTLRERVMSEEV